MRNFARINNYWNNIEARRNWKDLADEMTQRGYGDLVTKHTPPEGAGWRKIDKHIKALRDAIDKNEVKKAV